MTRVLVLCPDYSPPSGGIRKLYRHVDVLNRHGIPAAILHNQIGFRCAWFANSTPVSYAPQTPLCTDDILVVPEIQGPELAALAPGVPKVVFNQNAYLTFGGYTLDPNDRRNPYTSPEVLAAITVSEDNRDYLAFAFPQLRLFRLHYGIDTSLFGYRPAKRKQIAFMPRKNPQDVLQVFNLLKHRGSLAGFTPTPIDGRSEGQVALTLGESLLFFSFGHPEGCPLPPLEAMACGCVVVGYHGRGGREYFREDFCRPVEVGDVVGFARAAEGVMRAYESDPAGVLALGERASAHVRQHYSVDREEDDILAIWRALLTGAERY